MDNMASPEVTAIISDFALNTTVVFLDQKYGAHTRAARDEFLGFKPCDNTQFRFAMFWVEHPNATDAEIWNYYPAFKNAQDRNNQLVLLNSLRTNHTTQVFGCGLRNNTVKSYRFTPGGPIVTVTNGNTYLLKYPDVGSRI